MGFACPWSGYVQESGGNLIFMAARHGSILTFLGQGNDIVYRTEDGVAMEDIFSRGSEFDISFSRPQYPFPSEGDDYLAGYWSELLSWKLPHLGILSLFWKNIHSAWDDIVDRFPDALPDPENKECTPSNLMSLVERLYGKKGNGSWIDRAYGVIAGMTVGWVAYRLWGRRSNPSTSVHKIKRI
jgi:hypothetical protein